MNASPATVTWPGWRGSPELLVQIAHTSIRLMTAAIAPNVDASMVVDVKGAQEVFATPDGFKDGVSPEGLRDFDSITIEARADESQITVKLFRAPAEEWHQLSRGGVSLDVNAPAEHLPALQLGMSAAINRGRPRRYERTLLWLVTTVTAFAAVLSAIYLLDRLDVPGVKVGRFQLDPTDLVSSSQDVLFLVMGFVAFAVARWLRPAVEIAPIGETRFRRSIRPVFGPLVGLIVTALVTALWSAGQD